MVKALCHISACGRVRFIQGLCTYIHISLLLLMSIDKPSMKTKPRQRAWHLDTTMMRDRTLRWGRSWDLLLRRVHLETSYLDGQFVLDSSSGDLWGWEHHTHLHTDHALENVGGGINQGGVMRDQQLDAEFKILQCQYCVSLVCLISKCDGHRGTVKNGWNHAFKRKLCQIKIPNFFSLKHLIFYNCVGIFYDESNIWCNGKWRMWVF